MCYTRSSTLVHALPTQFPHLSTPGIDLVAIQETMANQVFKQTDKLVMHKLSNLLSQSSVEELLQQFVNSDEQEVCVLVANMQETSRLTINHIRVMIEEAELRSNGQHSKVFVLLLHFPPAQLFQHCYPALFLKGWDHIYLDTIVPSTAKGVVDVQAWFYKCCFPEETSVDEADSLLEALSHILHQAVPVISARVYFGNKNDNSFNSSMDATQRSDAIRSLLFEKGLGGILCEKFHTYWKPKVMVEYLERAAIFSKQRESTLNITDTIQTQVKALFVDFCVIMLTRANENFNLDIIYKENHSTPTYKLFTDMFKVSTVPELSQLHLLSNNLPVLQPPMHCPQFPFFTLVYSLMEDQVELSSKAANLKLDLLAERSNQSFCATPPDNARLKELIKAVLADLVSYLCSTWLHNW